MTKDVNKEVERIKQQEKAREAARIENKRIRDAVNLATSDANVLIILRHIFDISGFWESPIALTKDGDVSKATEYNAGRESIAHALLKKMDNETINAVLRKG